MIAIYARQSVDRADSISIEQQIDMCRYETKGRDFRTYTDKGFSGKDTNRPQFTQMMNDIRSGCIRTVIVYKLDRISRSILDFSNMLEIFRKYNVQFISATEKFDTSSPIGSAMLNICVVFAQLERETIQKRVADAYYSRSGKSFYMGGPVPYGFRKIPTVIGGIHTSMYEAVPEEAEAVRLIYEMYSQPDTSYGDIARRLNELGIKKRNGNWARQRIRDILTNPVYVKADSDVYDFFISNGAEVAASAAEFNGENGCYSYKGRAVKRKNLSSVKGDRIVPAPHRGIINSEIWIKCRRKCMRQRQSASSQKAKNSWLCGKIRCGECGYALIVRHSGSSRYLFCSRRLASKDCKGAGTLYADEIEQLVYAEIKKKLVQFPTLSCPAAAVPRPELKELETELGEANREIGLLLDKVGNSDAALFRYINGRINALEQRKTDIIGQIRKYEKQKALTANETDIHHRIWEELSFTDKRQVCDTLIQAVYATEKSIVIQWRF